MAKDIQTIDDDRLGPVPEVFRGVQVDVSDYLGGITPSFPVLSIKGGKFGIKFGGETTQFTEPDQRAGGQIMPVTFLDVVVVSVASRINKAFYLDPEWDETKRDPPDCWSADGIRPDDSIPAAKKQHSVCGTCPQNQRGSKIVKGKMLRACTDIQRLAIVRLDDIDNPLGPVLANIKPGSFSNYATYVQWLAGRHRAPFMVVTRLTFDIQSEFPKLQFQAIRGLSAEEATRIAEIQKHPIVDTILTSKNVLAFADPEQAEEDAAGGLPPTGGLPPAGAPAKQEWGKTTTVTKPTPPTPPTPASKPEPERKVTSYVAQPMNLKPDALEILTAEKQKIADLEAQLALAKAPKPEPEPEPVLTPEQLKIRELEAQLAQVKTTKPRGRPRSQPVGPPTSTASVTSPSNGSGESEKSADKFTNDLNLRIDKLAPKAT